MAGKWTTLEKGIRYREHPTRKNGDRRDRYFTLRFTVNGKRKEEALGWASEGWTLEKARVELARLREAARLGEGCTTLKQRREELAAKEEAERVKQITIGGFWESDYWPAQTGKSKGAKDAEKALWNHWLKSDLENIPFSKLAPIQLERIKTRMIKKGRSAATVKYCLALVSQLWNLARREGIVNEDCPTKKVKLPKKDNQRQRFLNPEEARQLLDELKARSYVAYAMAVISLFAGLRFSEVAALKWEDVNLDENILLIKDPKSKRNRYAHILKEMKEVLINHSQGQKRGLVFQSRNGGQIARPSKTFSRIANEMFNEDIDDPRQKVVFHTLRHTFASWLVQGGEELYKVKELMGHADLKMTQRYSHLAPEGLKIAAKSLEGKLDLNNSKVIPINEQTAS